MRRSAKGGPWARRIYLTSTAAFAGTLAALGLQVRAGADPAIKPTAIVPRPRLIITRKVITTKYLTKTTIHRRPAPVVATPVPVAVTQTAPIQPVTAAVTQSAPTQAAVPVVSSSSSTSSGSSGSNSTTTTTSSPSVTTSSSAPAPATKAS